MPWSVVGLDPLCAFYVRQVTAGGPVLVLGAADGAVACALAARGIEVTAVDPSSRMLEAAISRRESQGAGASLRFVHADLRTCRLTQRFPVVLAPQNALGLFPDELPAVCATIAAHLAPTGVFALDARAQVELPELPPGDPIPTRTGLFPHLRGRGRGAGVIHRYRQRAYHPRELDEALLGAGLEARERYADHQGTPFAGGELQIVIGGAR